MCRCGANGSFRWISRGRKNDDFIYLFCYHNWVHLKEPALTPALLFHSQWEIENMLWVNYQCRNIIIPAGHLKAHACYHHVTRCQGAPASSHTKHKPHVWHSTILTTARIRASRCCVHGRVAKLTFMWLSCCSQSNFHLCVLYVNTWKISPGAQGPTQKLSPEFLKKQTFYMEIRWKNKQTTNQPRANCSYCDTQTYN